MARCPTVDAAQVSIEVLPEWDEDWVVFERERIRQLRMHARDAIEAGLAAVAADPLRESAQRVHIDAHLAEGNAADTRRQFETYRELLWVASGCFPHPRLPTGLVAGSRWLGTTEFAVPSPRRLR